MKRIFILIAVVMTMLAAYGQQVRPHVVSQGETIATIAQMYGISPEKLVEANPELNQRFYAGMEIEIPLGQAAAQPTQPVSAPMPTPQVSSDYNAPKQEYSQQTNPQSGTPEQHSVTADDFSHWFLSYCAPFEGLDHGMYGLGWTTYADSGFGMRFSGHANYGIVDEGTLMFKLGPIYGKPVSDNVMIGAQLLANVFSDNSKDGEINGGVTILPHVSLRADRFVIAIGAEVGWINGSDDVYNAAHITIGYKF